VDEKLLQQALPARLQELIAYLAMHAGAPVSRLYLASIFWPEAGEDQAFGNLRKTLHDLRRALPAVDCYLQADRRHVLWRVDVPFRLDAAELEALAARDDAASIASAAALYTGDFLPACWDDWALTERERLRQVLVDVLGRGIERAEHGRDYHRAIEYARRLVEQEPLQEVTYRKLMRLYALTGDTARAVAAYHRCATTLERELGVEPGAATREAYELLLRQPLSARSGLVRTPLAGRTVEWSQLAEAWRKAATGPARAVLLIGDPGIGKSRLLEELIAWAQRLGVATLATRCYEAETSLSYGPVSALLRSAPLPTLDRTTLAEIGRLVPEVFTGHADVDRGAALSEPWQKSRFLTALADAVAGHAPAMVVVDDVQWIDAESLEWLHFLIRYRTPALLVTLAARPEGKLGDDRRAAFWHDLRADALLDEIGLAPLDAPATAALARSVSGTDDAGLDDDQLRRLHLDSEGNPFFLLEILRAGAAGAAMPRSVRAALEARFAGLTEDALELARTAAAIGRDFSLPVLAAVWPRSEESLVRGLDELWRTRIVRERGIDCYDFTHDKLRQAAYDGLGSAHRRLIHRRIGEALEAIDGSRPGAGGEIARHFENCGLTDRAAGYYVRAADAARLIYANREAIDLYRRALALSPAARTPATLLNLGDVLRTAGDFAQAGEVYREGIVLAREAKDPRNEARLRHGLGNVLKVAAALDDSRREFRSAAAMFAQLGSGAEMGSALAQVAIVETLRGEYGEAERLLDEALPLAEASGDPAARLLVRRAFSHLFFNRRQPEKMEEHARRELQLALAGGELRHEGLTLCDIGLAQADRGEYLSAIDSLARSLGVLQRIGYSSGTAVTAAGLGEVYRQLGEAEIARRCVLAAADVAAAIGNLSQHHALEALLGHMAAEAGRFAEAERLIAPAVDFLDANRQRFALCEALYFLADLRERQGRAEQAHALANRAQGAAAGLPRPDVLFRAELMRTRLAPTLGAVTPAEAARRLELMLNECPEPGHRAAIHYELWRLCRERAEDRAEAARLYRQLYSVGPGQLFRDRYHELTAETLPAVSVPPPPEPVRRLVGAELPRSGEAPATRLD